MGSATQEQQLVDQLAAFEWCRKATLQLWTPAGRENEGRWGCSRGEGRFAPLDSTLCSLIHALAWDLLKKMKENLLSNERKAVTTGSSSTGDTDGIINSGAFPLVRYVDAILSSAAEQCFTDAFRLLSALVFC